MSEHMQDRSDKGYLRSDPPPSWMAWGAFVVWGCVFVWMGVMAVSQ